MQGPPTPGATPETRIRLWRRLFVGWSTWELVFWALLVAAAALTRFWDLGTRALHHDESLHAYFSWLLAEGRGYRHDPLMHGPFQFHATALIFRLLGDSDASARYLPAFGGTAAVAVMALFRPYLGRVGALTGGLFMAISPTMLYFGRFVRNDIYMVVWGLLWAYGLWRYRDTGQVRFLTLGTVALALSFATKETAYITFALFMAFLAVANGPELARWLRSRLTTALSPAAEATWTWGTLLLPFFAAMTAVVLRPRGLSPTGVAVPSNLLDPAFIVPALMLSLFLGASIVLGLMASPSRWPRQALVFWAIEIVLYTTVFTNPQGLGTGVWGSLDYWLQQQDVRRGNQPWYYYGLLIGLYEFLPLALSLVALPRYVVRGGAFNRFLVVWAVGAVALYSYAGEKMPWLSLHVTLPLILLSARLLGEFLPWLARESSRSIEVVLRAAGMAAVPILALLVLLTARAAYIAAYVSSDQPVELLVYTQTSRQIPQLAHRIAEWAHRSGLGPAMPITVDGSSGFTWPWAWYLRRYTQVGYPSSLTAETLPAENPPVVLVHLNGAPALEPLLQGYTGERYPLRQWFPEGYRDMTPARLWRDLRDQDTRSLWWRYFLHRQLAEPLGSEDGVAYFKALPQ